MIALLTNGRFIKVKSHKNLDKYPNIQYLLINVDTKNRTDVYTMINGNQITRVNQNEIKFVDITMSYSDPDSGYDPDNDIKYNFRVNNIYNQFNIYPLIKQMEDINSYKDMVGEFTENRINPIKISFITKDKTYEWTETDNSDILEIFDKLNMKTHVRKLRDNYIIFKGNRWSLSSYIPLEFDWIAYPIRDSETLQLIPFDTFNKLLSVNELMIKVCIYNTKTHYEEYESDGVIDIYEHEFEQMLSHLFYLQTVLELDKYVNDSSLFYDISIGISKEPNEYSFINKNLIKYDNKFSSSYSKPEYVLLTVDDILDGVSLYQQISEIL